MRLGSNLILSCSIIWTYYCTRCAADWLLPNTYPAFACYTALQFVEFGTIDKTKGFWDVLCTNKEEIDSFAYCAAIYCSPDEIHPGYDAWNGLCELNTGITLPTFVSIIDKLEPGELVNIKRISQKDAFSNVYNESVVPDRAFYELAYRSNAGFYDNINNSMNFAWGLYGFWVLVILIGMINRMNQILRSSSMLAGSWLRRTLILPATFGKRCQTPIKGLGTIPPRMESLIITLYVILNVVFCFPGYTIFAGDLYGPIPETQVIRYVADRTGVLLAANLPLVWIFSARNDPLLWITGWSYSTYSHFHRWVARITVAEIFVHSVVYTRFFTFNGTANYYEEWAEPYFYCGVIGTIISFAMLATASYYLRAKNYDLFLVLHICMAIVLLVVTYYHLALVGSKYLNAWIPFLWPCVAMWALDRIARFMRVLFHSTKSVTAQATYERGSEIIRLDVSDMFGERARSPGTFYYVYGPSSLVGYESHPFTLCSWNHPSFHATRVSDPGDKSQPAPHEIELSSDTQRQRSHTFLIRPYKGFTRRLKDQVIAKYSLEGQSHSGRVTILLEGPYGIERVLGAYSDVLFIAGGSGITPAISYAHALTNEWDKTALRVAWAVREKELADSVCANELGAVIRNPRFHLDVYLTKNESKEATQSSGDPYTAHSGRPDIEVAVRDARARCKGRLAVMCCGPPRMTDSCRKAVVRVMGEAGAEMNFFNEMLTW